MATAPTLNISAEIIRRVVSSLAGLTGIESIHYLETDTAFSIWVGIRDDNPATRQAVYEFEDTISQTFHNIVFDFHVVALPTGRRMEELMSDTQAIFQRTA